MGKRWENRGKTMGKQGKSHLMEGKPEWITDDSDITASITFWKEGKPAAGAWINQSHSILPIAQRRKQHRSPSRQRTGSTLGAGVDVANRGDFRRFCSCRSDESMTKMDGFGFSLFSEVCCDKLKVLRNLHHLHCQTLEKSHGQCPKVIA